MRSARWEDFELVVLTLSDFEPAQPYGAALTEVRQNPAVLFVLGEGFVYSGGAAFHRAFQQAGTWDDGKSGSEGWFNLLIPPSHRHQ